MLNVEKQITGNAFDKKQKKKVSVSIEQNKSYEIQSLPNKYNDKINNNVTIFPIIF